MVRASRPTTWLYLAGPLLITGVGFAIRAHGLQVDSLWLDEILTQRAALADFGTLFSQRDHPPFLYLLTRLSLAVFEDGAFALRLPSLFIGTLALPLIYRFGKEVGCPAAGLWTALLLALTPYHLRHVQEARHYALLLTVTVATYLLLYGALQRPTWRAWIAFGMLTVVNLYTHYASLIVLLSQSILIGLWLSAHLWRGRHRMLRYPLTAAALISLLYLPWLPHLQTTLLANVGPAGVAGQGRQIANSIDLWFGVAFAAFTPASELLRYALPALFLAGILVLLTRRAWLTLALVGSGLFLPLVLLYLFPVSREPYPRYVIYALPFYLLPIGLALGSALHRVHQRHRLVGASFTTLLVILLLFIYPPLLRAEYDFVLNDWASVQAYLTQVAAEDDLLLGLSLEFPTGYNHVTASLPYYLDNEEREYLLVSGSNLSLPVAEQIAASEGQVWAIFTSGGMPVQLDDSSIVVPFQTDIFLAYDPHAPSDTWAATVDLYQQLIPLAAAPSPQCYLQLDLAALYTARAHYEEAGAALGAATAQCPEGEQGDRRATLQCAVAGRQLQQQVNAGKRVAAQRSALELLACNEKEPLALDILTADDLLASYQTGEARVAQNNSPEPVAVHTFTMPHNGDWGEVLFIHPPAAVSFPLTLPVERSVALHTRVALDPQSWTWGGDGATFVVTVETVAGTVQELYREHVSNEPAAQDWHDVDLSLAPYAGQQITLTLTVEAGPAGDATGDWAGWETPRLLWETAG